MKFRPARIALCFGLMVGTPMGVSTFAYAQDADAAASEYAGVLNQIQDAKLARAQRELMVAQQAAKIENLRAQIKTVPQTKASVRSVVTEMVAEIEKVMKSDLPFREEERFARLDRLRVLLDKEGTLDSDLFRRAITLYDIEANYGYTISAYTGDHPTTPGRRLAACREDLASPVCNLSKDMKERLDNGFNIDGKVGDDADVSGEILDGNYVHFGRLSFIYLDLDSREGMRWSKDAGEGKGGWEPLSSGDILNARKSVRIARGESAPGVVTAPIKMQAAQ